MFGIAVTVRGNALRLSTRVCRSRHAESKLNLEKLDGVEMQGSMNITLATTGISMEIPLQFHAYMDGLKGESPVLLFELGATFMQQDIQMTGYQENDYQYTVMKAGGQTIKSKQPVENEEEDSKVFSNFSYNLHQKPCSFCLAKNIAFRPIVCYTVIRKVVEIQYEKNNRVEYLFVTACCLFYRLQRNTRVQKLSQFFSKRHSGDG